MSWLSCLAVGAIVALLLVPIARAQNQGEGQGQDEGQGQGVVAVPVPEARSIEVQGNYISGKQLPLLGSSLTWPQ